MLLHQLFPHENACKVENRPHQLAVRDALYEEEGSTKWCDGRHRNQRTPLCSANRNRRVVLQRNVKFSCCSRKIRVATPLKKDIDALGDSALDDMVRFGNRGGGRVGCGVGSHCRWML